jgi:hypothetical protein
MFHANPLIYDKDDCPNPFNKKLSSSQIWEKDKDRNDFVTAHSGYILTIWESDFKNNKENIISYCVNQIIEMMASVKEEYDELSEEWIYG